MSENESAKPPSEILMAANVADWGQVVANGGPPCFHVETGRFCLRAERWMGHGEDTAGNTFDHKFVSLYGLLEPLVRKGGV